MVCIDFHILLMNCVPSLPFSALPCPVLDYYVGQFHFFWDSCLRHMNMLSHDIIHFWAHSLARSLRKRVPV